MVLAQRTFLLIVSEFNKEITDSLLKGAKETFIAAGCPEDHLKVIYVPGAFELPLTASKAAKSKQWDAIVCLGCVIRGGTPHFDYVCAETARGIMNVNLDEQIPVIFGVLTTDTYEQALVRAGLKTWDSTSERIEKKPTENKGVDAAQAAMDMVLVLSDLDQTQSHFSAQPIKKDLHI